MQGHNARAQRELLHDGRYDRTPETGLEQVLSIDIVCAKHPKPLAL